MSLCSSPFLYSTFSPTTLPPRQAEQFEVHGAKLNGKLTCGENIADLGGVKLALRALKRYLATQLAISGEPAPLINGFSPEQRLFLAWAQAWRENGTGRLRVCASLLSSPPLSSLLSPLPPALAVKKERAIQLVTLDPHGPNELRCNGTLSNVPEFLEVRTTASVPHRTASLTSAATLSPTGLRHRGGRQDAPARGAARRHLVGRGGRRQLHSQRITRVGE
jgi:hypothetical protein